MIEYADLIGAPFKSHGRDIKTGVDCYGLVQAVFRREGIELPWNLTQIITTAKK